MLRSILTTLMILGLMGAQPSAGPSAPAALNAAALQAACVARQPAGPGAPPPITEPTRWRIDAVETTQGLAPEDGRYVAARATAVLVGVSIAPGATVPLPAPQDVAGCLHVFADGVLAATVAATDVQSGVFSGSHALVFASFSLDPAGEVALVVEVVAAQRPATTTYAVAVVDGLHFDLEPVAPEILYAPVAFGTVPPPDATLIDPPNGDALLRGVLPVRGNWLYTQANLPAIIVSDVDDDCIFAGNAEGDVLLKEEESPLVQEQLGIVRETTVVDNVGSTELRFTYGWIADPPGACGVLFNGLSSSVARISYGSTTPETGQRTFAHEIFHHIRFYELGDKGHEDPSVSIGQDGWDVENLLPGTWTAPGVLQRKESASTFVLMISSDDRATHETWISQTDANIALSYLTNPLLRRMFASRPPCPEVYDEGIAPCLAANNIAISGVFDAEGNEVIIPVEFFRMPWLSQPTYTYSNYDPAGTPFALVFRARSEIITVIPFDASMIVEEGDGEIVFGYFNVVVPETIVLQADAIAVRNADSVEIPLPGPSGDLQIEMIEPVSGELGEAIAVEISGALEDGGEGSVRCRFVYSPNGGSPSTNNPDGGGLWLPVQVRPAEDEDPTTARLNPSCPNGGHEFVITNREQLPTGERSVLRASVSEGSAIDVVEVVLQ